MSQPTKGTSLSTVIVRPSDRLIRPVFTLAFVLFALVFFYNNNREAGRIDSLHFGPGVVLAIALVRKFKRRFTTMTIGGGKLKYETGILSKQTRTLDLSRIQDVRVDQKFVHRIFGLGTITVETAGETGRISMDQVENPHGVAEFILESARKQSK